MRTSWIFAVLAGCLAACSSTGTDVVGGNVDAGTSATTDAGNGAFDAHVSPPVGSTLTRVTIVGGSATADNVFVSFGQVFAAGDVPATATIAGRAADGSGVLLQVDKKATYDDGSLRHAVITAVVPHLTANTDFPIDLVSTPMTAPSPGLDVSALAGTAFDATVTATIGGTAYSASARPLLASATQAWLDGPVVKEVSVSTPLKDGGGNAHPMLMARFRVRMYAGATSARVDVVVENDWAYAPAPAHVTYDLSVKVAGTERYARAGLVHYAHARWRQTHYWGREAEPFVKHDRAYVVSTGAVPNYDPTVMPSSDALAGYAKTAAAPWDPMQIGEAEAYMPATGGRSDIGIIPGWAAMWLLSNDAGAARATLRTADGAGSWPMHYRDQKTDRPVSLEDHPYMTILGNPGDAVNPATNQSEGFPDCADCATPYTVDTAHQPALVYLPYLLTGDPFYLEELQFWACYDLLESNPYYRDKEKGLLKSNQVRGQAWSLRTLGEVAAFTPDADPMKAYFVTRMNNNLDYYNGQFVGGPQANALGLLTEGGAFAYRNGTGVASWQDDFFTSAIGHLVELGFSKAAPLLSYKATTPIGRMIAPGYCWISAAPYEFVVRDVDGGPLYTTFAEVYAKTADPAIVGLDCNSQQMADALMLKRGQMTGYADGPQGYPSNMQPALAMSAQSGAPGGKDAWSLFAARPIKPDYSGEPQFAIVPR